MEHVWHIGSPVGDLTLTEEEGALTGLYFGRLSRPGEAGPTALLEEAARQLREYFAGQRREFDLPLCLRGTAFQMQVWQALQAIPYGEVRTPVQHSFRHQRRHGGDSHSRSGARGFGLERDHQPLSQACDGLRV